MERRGFGWNAAARAVWRAAVGRVRETGEGAPGVPRRELTFFFPSLRFFVAGFLASFIGEATNALDMSRPEEILKSGELGTFSASTPAMEVTGEDVESTSSMLRFFPALLFALPAPGSLLVPFFSTFSSSTTTSSGSGSNFFSFIFFIFCTGVAGVSSSSSSSMGSSSSGVGGCSSASAISSSSSIASGIGGCSSSASSTVTGASSAWRNAAAAAVAAAAAGLGAGMPGTAPKKESSSSSCAFLLFVALPRGTLQLEKKRSLASLSTTPRMTDSSGSTSASWHILFFEPFAAFVWDACLAFAFAAAFSFLSLAFLPFSFSLSAFALAASSACLAAFCFCALLFVFFFTAAGLGKKSWPSSSSSSAGTCSALGTAVTRVRFGSATSSTSSSSYSDASAALRTAASSLRMRASSAPFFASSALFCSRRSSLSCSSCTRASSRSCLASLSLDSSVWASSSRISRSSSCACAAALAALLALITSASSSALRARRCFTTRSSLRRSNSSFAILSHCSVTLCSASITRFSASVMSSWAEAAR
mmetsp:Transcript_10335/g.42036  ORF Transcript_10335/g.42036 Transcript_10335/m.42036 type:complete len:536 (-) Transcript_10335:1567-3174(-)